MKNKSILWWKGYSRAVKSTTLKISTFKYQDIFCPVTVPDIRTICCGVTVFYDWLRAGRSGDRIPVGARFSAPIQTGPGTHTASCTMGKGSFQGVKSGRGVTLIPQPLLVPLVMKGYSYSSTPPMGRKVCVEPQCLYKGALYVYLYGWNDIFTSDRQKKYIIFRRYQSPCKRYQTCYFQ